MSLRIPNPKVVAKVQGADPSFNKFQDQLLGVTNHFMRQVSENIGTMPIFNTASRPTANASSAGQIIQLQDEGTAALVQVCLPNADGAYAWLTLADHGWVQADTAVAVDASIGFTKVYTTGTLPVASAAMHGFMARVKDPGVTESLKVCLQKADGTYVWVNVVTAP